MIEWVVLFGKGNVIFLEDFFIYFFYNVFFVVNLIGVMWIFKEVLEGFE